MFGPVSVTNQEPNSRSLLRAKERSCNANRFPQIGKDLAEEVRKETLQEEGFAKDSKPPIPRGRRVRHVLQEVCRDSCRRQAEEARRNTFPSFELRPVHEALQMQEVGRRQLEGTVPPPHEAHGVHEERRVEGKDSIERQLRGHVGIKLA